MSIDAKNLAFFRRVYADIINGYTLSLLNGNEFYIKHLSVTEQGLIDANFIDFYEKAVSKGINKEETVLARCEKAGTWTQKDERFFDEHSLYIDGLIQTKKQLFLRSDIDRCNEQIKSAHIELGKKRKARESILGFTAELYAAKKINELYIKYSYYRDKKCLRPLFNDEAFSYLDDEELNSFIQNYNMIAAHISGGAIKQIAIKEFFQSSFALAEDSVYNFYGKAICKLTFYQTELAAYGRYFRRILENSSPPNDVKNDPDKLIDWYTSSQNSKKVLEDTKGSVGVVGASLEDINSSGQSNAQNFYDMVRGKKNLSPTELMKLSGVEGV